MIYDPHDTYMTHIMTHIHRGVHPRGGMKQKSSLSFQGGKEFFSQLFIYFAFQKNSELLTFATSTPNIIMTVIGHQGPSGGIRGHLVLISTFNLLNN